MLIIVLLIIGSLSTYFIQSVRADAPNTHQFYGHVSINGSPPSEGYSVTAGIGGIQVASCTTDSQGRYGYNSPFTISGQNGQTITFYVENVTAVPTATYSSGSITQLDLSVSGSVPPPAASCGISPTILPAGVVGTPYSAQLQASGGAAPYVWSISSGALPGGLLVDNTTGLISGTPTTSQSYSFTIHVDDNASHHGNAALSIQISTVQTITAVFLAHSENFSLTGGVLSAAHEFSSEDGSVRFSLQDNTSMDLKGQLLLGAAPETNPPASTDNSTLICVYSFSPAGATFSPAARLTLKYDVKALPAAANETDLYIAYWTGSAWQSLTSTVNTTTKEVYALVSHFTRFAIRCPAVTSTTTTTNTTTTTTTTTTIATSVLGTSDNFSLSGGIIQSAASIVSADGRLTLSFADNTTVNLQGSQQLIVTQLSSPPAAPAGNRLVAAYSFEPDNATFSPALTVTIKYNTAEIPSDVSESSFYIALLEGSSWIPLPSTVNTENKTVTAQVSHFSTYGLLGAVSETSSTVAPPAPIAPAPPAAATTSSFSVSDLAVTPALADPGQPVNVSVRVINGDTVESTKTIMLKVNDQNEAQKDVTLAAGKSQIVSFTVNKSQPGKYTVGIGGLSDGFEIKAAAPANEQPSGLSLPILIVIALGGLAIIVFVIKLIFRQT